ncbi:RNA-binding ATPase activator esf2 [Sorochytrium milnesiophthora]
MSDHDQAEGQQWCYSDSDNDGASLEAYSGSEAEAEQEEAPTSSPPPPRKQRKTLDGEAVAEFTQKKDRTGLVYLSRVPPFMQPHRLRALLAPYGEIGKLYVAQESAKSAQRRKKYKGNSRKNFTEGWVEFLDKRVAKTVASTLNNTIIGGKKTSRFHDDIWNIRYLPKFKWSHLTEQLAYERKQREQRLRAEILQAKRENRVYLDNVAKGKMEHAIEARKRKRKPEQEENTGDHSGETATAEATMGKVRRTFRQRKVVVDPEERRDGAGQEDLGKVKHVLGKIFG